MNQTFQFFFLDSVRKYQFSANLDKMILIGLNEMFQKREFQIYLLDLAKFKFISTLIAH
jgi:hypothetical protein